mgnify:FL=1|jgi:hypothetical protein|tara:strand:- start:2940 stop:3326 length:387 start_codon:yes stop_codon:yes gene_type:complete
MKKKWILRDHRVQDLCVDYIDSIDTRPDDLVEVIVRPYKKNRSLEQNDMFHAWCGTIAEQTGHSKGEIKDILIESVFGTEEYLNLQGEKRSRLRATSDMNVGEMSELIERTTQIGIELGAEVPEVTHG